MRGFATLLRREIGLIAILLLFAGGVLGFLGLADMVSDGHTVAFDTAVMQALLGEAISPRWSNPPY